VSDRQRGVRRRSLAGVEDPGTPTWRWETFTSALSDAAWTRSFTSTTPRRSSGVSNIERTSMRDFLLRFEGSVYFGKAVAPELK